MKKIRKKKSVENQTVLEKEYTSLYLNKLNSPNTAKKIINFKTNLNSKNYNKILSLKNEYLSKFDVTKNLCESSNNIIFIDYNTC